MRRLRQKTGKPGRNALVRWLALALLVTAGISAGLVDFFPVSAATASISGNVFEDKNFAGGIGRSKTTSAGVGLNAVRVELYTSAGVFVAATTTASTGAYTFSTAVTGTSYIIRVVTSTVPSARTGYTASCLAVQTFRTIPAATGAAAADTARVGGEAPEKVDAPSNTTSAAFSTLTTATTIAQSQATTPALTGNVTGVDFGFSFSPVVNTNDSGQGSFRQWVINQNALAHSTLAISGVGAATDKPIFMITDGQSHAGLRSGLTNQLTNGVAVITLSTALPALSITSTQINGGDQTTNIGDTNSGTIGFSGTVGTIVTGLFSINKPEIEITAASSGTIATGLDAENTNINIFSIAINRFGTTTSNGNILFGSTATSGTSVQNSVVGMHATDTGDPGSQWQTNNIVSVGAQITLNSDVIGYAYYSNLMGTGSASSFSLNSCPDVMYATTQASILISGGRISINQSYIHDNPYGGLDASSNVAGTGNNLVTSSTFAYNGTAGNLLPAIVFGNGSSGTNSVTQTIIHHSGGAGVLLRSTAANSKIYRNVIYSFGTIPLDLLSASDNQTTGTSTYHTLNDSGDGDAGADTLLNYPVLQSATISGANITITGWARPGASIDLYTSATGAGEWGEPTAIITNLGQLAEGASFAPVDNDATSTTYSGTINGLNQGTDTTNRFSFTFAVPSGVTPGTVLTASGSISNNASEYSGNVVVTSFYTISGHIQTPGGVAISGVSVALSGSASATTTTDASGNYSFANVQSNGNYTVTPTKAGTTFTPANLTYNNLSANQPAANFTGSPTVYYTISGHILNASGLGVNGATVTLSGGQAATTTTDFSGAYSFTNLPDAANYTVTPTKTNYTFNPASLTYNALSANQTSADFTGTSTVTYSIGGHIQNVSGIATSGVTVTLSGGQAATTTTDASGNYSFAGLPSTNNYVVTPTKANYTFSPASQSYTNLAANQTADFTGTSTVTYTISGHIQNASAISISGVTVTLSGGQSATTTTDASGNYSFSNLPSTNNYTVTPSLANYTFSPTSLTYTNLGANQPASNFTSTSTITYAVSGHIQDGASAAIAGVTVTLSGGQAATATTDASGNYSFSSLPSGNNYVVTPAKTNYAFAPLNLSYNSLAANQAAANFTGTLSYSISGHIQDGSSTAVSGVTVALTGSTTSSATTDASGNYTFSALTPGGNYTVTPTKTGYIFSPPNRVYNSLSANQGAADFTATLVYTISGHIQDNASAAIAGVTITLSGSQSQTASTDASGNYSFPNLPAGLNYTVTPSKLSYSFAPANLTYNNLSSAQAAANFTGTVVNYTVSGHVQTAGATPISGVLVNFVNSQGSSTATLTDASGNYTIARASGFDYTVTPSKANYTFSPASTSLIALSANQTVNFTATLNTFTISGHIQTAGAAAIAGVTVTLSGGQTGTATTDASGNYSFTNLPAGLNYTLTPAKTYYTFFAASLTYNNLTANQGAADYTGTIATYSISGHIQDEDTLAFAGVTVTLSGGQSSSTTTASNGNYTFSGLPAGSNYTVTAAKAGFTFTPSSRTYNTLSSNQVAANFTSIGLTYTISGHIQNSVGASISGATVTLSGSMTASATTDASGNYSFTFVPWGGNYTVTPAKTSYTFSPASRTYINLAADQPATNFTATLVVYTISGHVADWNNSNLSGVTVALTGSASASATTDASGNYSFAGLAAGGNYVVTPTKAGYAFSPASISHNNLSADIADSFMVTVYYPFGWVTDKTTGAGIAGVTITLSGTHSEVVVTDSNGYYSLSGYPATGSYIITPTKTNYNFDPVSLTLTDLSQFDEELGNEYDFTGALVPNVTFVASSDQTGSVRPGTEIVYNTDFTNGGAGEAHNLVITLPIPAHTDFKVGSAGSDLKTTSLSVAIVYSNDGAVTWNCVPASGAGGAPAGYDRSVTHVRWVFTGLLSPTAPNNTGQVSLHARIQ